MIPFEEVRKYLPSYLSDFANDNLFSEIEAFPENINERLYTSYLKNSPIIYQGDGISGLLHATLPDLNARKINGMIISNTCDVDTNNSRWMETKIVHAPILKLENYKNLLIKHFVDTGKKNISSINSHLEVIKYQQISHIFYLPAGGDIEEDSMVMFDHVTSLPSSYLTKDEIIKNRLFTLSDFGFYLFLFKLSIHFTRIREDVSRNPPSE